MSRQVWKVRVPATTANLGPGFDVLGLALDLWNEATFTLEGDDLPPGSEPEWQVTLEGEGAARLPTDGSHLSLQAFRRVYEAAGRPLPRRVHLQANNAIPVGSGLGSSAAAVVAGLLAANLALGMPFSLEDLLRLGLPFEGHADNLAPALWGGLTAVWEDALGGPQALRLPLYPVWEGKPWLAVVVPAMDLPTQVARQALPEQVPYADAVFNLGRLTLLLEALRRGDADLLAQAVADRLHEPYRRPLLPGVDAVFQAAREAGAVAVTLSGAGPGVVAFAPTLDHAAPVAEAMLAAWEAQGMAARAWALRPAPSGALAYRMLET